MVAWSGDGADDREGATVTPADWVALWRDVAVRVADHREAGRGHLLTEDTVRMETVRALEQAGVVPKRVRIEVPNPAVLGKGKLDLVVDPPDGVVVELKYPRDSATGFSPDTMTLGELLRDFLRVAAVAADDRWVVQVLNDRLVKYLVAAFARYDLQWAGAPKDVLRLPHAAIAALPKTAKDAIDVAAVAETVSATLEVREPVGPVGEKLTLFAYRVDGLAVSEVDPLPADAPPEPSIMAGALTAAVTRDGARQEILDAARAVVARSAGAPFTMPDVIAEMDRRGSGYAEATIRTMISAHLCAESTGEGVAGYADFTRVGRGLYRFRTAERSPEDLRPVFTAEVRARVEAARRLVPVPGLTLELSADDVALLRAGLGHYGTDMRWLAVLDPDPGMPGRPETGVLRLWRSWTGMQIFEARVTLHENDTAVLTDLLVESDPEIYRSPGNDELHHFRQVLASEVLQLLRDLRAGRAPIGS